MKRVLSLTLLAGLATAASHAWVVSAGGPIRSDGPVGSVNNDTITAVYSDPNTIFGAVSFSGNLTEVNTGTYASEARWQIRNTAFPYALNAQMTTTGNFTGTIAISASIGLFAWANSGTTFQFEAYESFNDSGIDSTWSDVRFDFSNASTTFLGNYAFGTNFTMDTFTSSFDTEIALYDANGTRLADNDDSGGLQSQINPGVLPVGTYVLLGTGYNAGFINGLAVAGTANGNLNMQINGATVYSGAHAAGQMRALTFNVVPEPGTMIALAGGLGALVMRRRRRGAK